MRTFSLVIHAFLAVTLALTTFAATPVRAADAEDPAPSAARAASNDPAAFRPVFALTISPLHLVFPIVELTGELRVDDHVGVAVIGGVGKYTDKNRDLSATVFEAGAQFRYYAVGDFRHGMQLGAELLYLHLSTDQFTASGQGLAMGPFIGYKYTANVGFTFDAQLGAEYVGARATASNGSSSGSASNSAWIPLLNLNVGWSF